MADIETSAVRAVCEYLSYSKRIETFIPERDKEYIWDGMIYLFNDKKVLKEPRSKNNMNGRVPSQVKGKTVDAFSRNTSSKPYERSDLTTYMKDGGVILFLVEITEELNKKLFYRVLLPYDIKTVLKNSDAKEPSIKHYEVGDMSAEEFERILLDFLSHRTRQYSVFDADLMLEDATEYLILAEPFYKDNPINPKMSMLGRETFLYGRRAKEDIYKVISKITITNVASPMELKISTDKKNYFSSIIEYKSTNNNDYHTYDDIIKIDSKKANDRYDTKITLCDNLTFLNRLKGLEFLIDIYGNNVLYVNGNKVELPQFEEKNKIKELKNAFSYLQKVEKLLNLLNIDMNFKYNELKETDWNNIDYLVYGFIDKKSVRVKSIKPTKRKVKILDYEILIISIPDSENTCRIFDINSRDLLRVEYKVNEPEENYFYNSIYLLLNEKDLLTSTNVDCSLFYDDITRFEYSKYASQLITGFILENIKAFDTSNKIEFLDISLKLCNWLLDNCEDDYANIINKYQIQYRKNPLKSNDFLKLNTFLDLKEYEQADTLNCCIYLLFEDYSKFEKSFAVLGKEKREAFKDYPIYSLYINRK